MTDSTLKIVGIRFKTAGRVYYYDPGGVEYKLNDQVVVMTPRGQKIGQIIIGTEEISSSKITEPLKPVMRLATPEDIAKATEFNTKESEVLAEAAKIVAKFNLPMKLIMAERNLEGSQMTIYFKAEERVDFRELVKELNSYFKMRIELRQVGPRDEAKLIGGYGRCGRPLCCATFLDEFAPVSIKMAKQQSLPLNPMKIAGSCGRLLCCLAYEAEHVTKKGAIKKQPIIEDEDIESLEYTPDEGDLEVKDISNSMDENLNIDNSNESHTE